MVVVSQVAFQMSSTDYLISALNPKDFKKGIGALWESSLKKFFSDKTGVLTIQGNPKNINLDLLKYIVNSVEQVLEKGNVQSQTFKVRLFIVHYLPNGTLEE